jgi:hypothetical protein
MSEGRYGPRDAEVKRAITLIQSDIDSYLLCDLNWNLSRGCEGNQFPPDVFHSVGRLNFVLSTSGRRYIYDDLRSDFPPSVFVPLLCLALKDRIQWLFNKNDFMLLTEPFRIFVRIMQETENDQNLRLLVIDLLRSMTLDEALESARLTLG